MHLFEHAVYEHRLPSALPHGLCHVVLEAQQLQPLRQQALAAGAVEIMPFAEVDAALGTREGAFLRSPGGGCCSSWPKFMSTECRCSLRKRLNNAGSG